MAFNMPNIDPKIACHKLHIDPAGKSLLSFLDAYSGYNQIATHKPDNEKTAFVIERGNYYYKVMPFGLKNARATYQRLVNMMFKKHHGERYLKIEKLILALVVAAQKLKQYFQAHTVIVMTQYPLHGPDVSQRVMNLANMT
ncbi:uncharacterized protein LOC126629689 [Malus sylvestris]|uniref:uncharacterized protein LOC126629689 n=1 Tax=Malus sylvestris TaxID=3752 RepID=UPI0021AC0E40|nr:uncharacterized protein LOC126629689 [Malus sylvestris]